MNLLNRIETQQKEIEKLKARIAELERKAKLECDISMDEYNRLRDGVNEMFKLEEDQMKPSNHDCVICPNCSHEFGAVPVNVQERLDKTTLAWNSACAQRDEFARDKELLNEMVYRLAKKIKEGCGWARPTEEQIEDEIRWVKEEIKED